MFARPGLCGMGIGRLGLVAASRPSLVAQALAILANYGSAANLYLPGVGAINGITAGNWLDSTGTTAATFDDPVGLVVSAGKAVGPELIDYSIGVLGSNYIARGTSVAVGGGFYTVTGNNAVASVVASPNPLLGVNKTYKVMLSIQSAGPVVLHLSNSQNSSLGPAFLSKSAIGDYDVVVTTDYVKDTITAFCGSTGVSTTFKVSVSELPGAHLTQSTAANRPVLRLSGGVYSWQFDGSNDSFTSTLTPGNAGFFCSGAQVNDSGVLRTLLGAGASSDAMNGVSLFRNANNAIQLFVGDGMKRNNVSAAYPVATNSVASAGWDASTMFVGVGNTETSSSKSVNCETTRVINVGNQSGIFMFGTIGATIIMPTVLPTATERATLRQFIASLSGVTM